MYVYVNEKKKSAMIGVYTVGVIFNEWGLAIKIEWVGWVSCSNASKK